MDSKELLNSEVQEESEVIPEEYVPRESCDMLGEEEISGLCESDKNDNSAVFDNVQEQDVQVDEKDAIDMTFANCTVSELYELAKEYPKENVAEDILSEPFHIFSKQRTGSAKEIYSEYLELKRSFSESKQTNNMPARGLSGQENKRAYSGFAQVGAHRDVSSGLTGRQMQIARESGMSFREYAELLSSLPRGRNL